MMKKGNFRLILLTAVSLSSLIGGEAQAQQAAGTDATDDIIVTARKREETSIAVPVVITAIGSGELQRRGISSIDNLARLVPQLTIGEGGGTVQGGSISLRGISGPDTNPFGDQAVSFNIDSVQVAKSSVRRLGNFDVAQVEVLKGPQALFFGKNSPGGVISMRTADPTSQLEAKVSAGYEFKAREWRGEGYISGPLSDTLGARLAFFGSDMDGWAKNIAAQGSIYSPKRTRVPETTEWGLRGTLLFQPTDKFTARLKYTYGKGHGSGGAANFQYVSCPYGTPQFAGIVDECKANNRVSHADVGPTFSQYDPRFKDGETYSRVQQQLASLELNYDLTDQLRLTSVTGFYKVKFLQAENFTTGVPTVPLPELFPGFSLGLPLLPSINSYSDRETTQEVRLQSSFDGPLNFTIGGLYQDTHATSGAHTFASPTNVIEFNEYDFTQEGSAYSFFAQLSWQIVPTLELSGGGRYSHEKKRLSSLIADQTGNRSAPGVQVFPNPDRISFNDFSPEATISYRPSQDLTVFGSYKRGFLSGGFNSSSSDTRVPLDYKPQKVRGFEGGIKASLFDRTLRLNFAAYSYKVLGLQITSYADTVSTIRNAGKVSIKGAEVDFNYRAPVDGLTFRGALTYNRGRYVEYLGPCYNGQSAAMGCNAVNDAGNPVQDLAGTQLRNAPKWAGSVGFGYETPVANGLKVGISSDVNFTASELTDAKSIAGLRSPKRALIDATVRLAEEDDRWELALIGRNLTNKHYWVSGQEVPLSGSAGGFGADRLSDYFAVVSRGREMMIRATYKFGS